MRALLFTVFGVFVAAAAGVSYLAFSPAPERTSDSLKLVIETGSIPSTRTAEDANGDDAPTGALGAADRPSREGGKEPTLDEVIAARLKQAGESAPDEASAGSAAPQATQTADQATATAAAPDQEQEPAETSAPESATATASDDAEFAAPDTASAPPGTVSITQMLAAELNNDDGASDESAEASAQPTEREPSGAQDAEATADAETATGASSDQVKTAGRLQPGTESTADQPDGSATAESPETSAPAGDTGETAIAALDPRVEQGAAPATAPSDTEIPTATEEQPTAGPQDAAESADALPKLLSAAEAPALPRQRGDFKLRGRIALILRGLGVEADLTERAIAQLPQQVAMAFVPYGDDLGKWTQRARQDRHDILLQIPLEPKGYPETNPGPHTLLTSLSIDENLEHLDWLLDRFQGMTGVTNYLGSKFASSPGSFAPMLMELKARDLIYVDDSKAANATTRQLARQVSLAYSVADVVIDTTREPEAIQRKLSEVEAQAGETGAAIAIGHAHATTLSEIESWLNSLNDKGFALVPITELTTPPTPRVSQSTGG